MGRLTAREVESFAKTRGRYGDGDGMYLRVLDPGRRIYWVYRYRLAGKEREISIGPYPEVSLADARVKHAAHRNSVVVHKRDPLADKRAAKASASNASAASKPTFGECADAYLARQEERGQLGKNATHRRQWHATLGGLPQSFRNLTVDEIGPRQVFDALDPIWAKTPETASRLRGRIAMVLDFARGPEDARPNPAAWSGWLKNHLGSAKALGKIDRKTGERVARGNYAALAYVEVSTFVARLSEVDTTTALALEFLILTATRTSETLRATWREFDLKAAVWAIPPERTKTGDAHSVPLCVRALDILAKARKRARKTPTPDTFVFPGGRPRQPFSAMTFPATLRRMGVEDATAHGFRTSFRTWASEVAHAEFEVAEACLGHRIGNAVSRAYNRTTLLERRRPLMDAWADHVTGKTSAKVVPIKVRAPKRARA